MWFNPIVRFLLRSPFHGLVDRHTMLVGYQGRKSGKLYETPVNFVRHGDDILVTSRPERAWWRNFVAETPATLWLDGKPQPAVGRAYTSPDDITAYLGAYLRHMPGVARYFDVALDESGLPRPDDVARAAGHRVIVRLRLSR